VEDAEPIASARSRRRQRTPLGRPRKGASMADEAEDIKQVSVSPGDQREKVACTPVPLRRDKLNKAARIPYGLTTEHIYEAMNEFVNFIGFINTQLNTKNIQRFESMLMPANFSSMVGEFMTATLPKYCPMLVKNQYHNGHPDMLPKGKFPKDALQHGTEGIEVKGSRYAKAWQGHNAEDIWLMVFVFDSNRPVDASKGIGPKPFQFKAVYLGELTKADWKFAGRSETSRRTITASVTTSGFEKMTRNWIYKD
jgi:hypothetical protein